MDLGGIKNIIFDLGGVIINLNQDLTKQAFKKLFGDNYDELEKALHLENLLNNFETGKITSDEFVSFFQEFNAKFSFEKISEAWSVMLLDIPKERLELINVLSNNYRIFLLSNTNEIHLQYINQYVEDNFEIESISVPFEKAYYSHELGMRKPNSEIFETVLKDKSLVAGETLFIDDSKEHIIAAKKLHLKTHHLLPSETILDIFNEN